jgi:hypothetical protein
MLEGLPRADKETYGSFLERSTVSTIGQEGGALGELRETGDTKVFLVRVLGVHDLFGLGKCKGLGM